MDDKPYITTRDGEVLDTVHGVSIGQMLDGEELAIALNAAFRTGRISMADEFAEMAAEARRR